MKNIGVAIAGTGFMGAVHTEALRRVGVNLIGILGSSKGKSQAAASQLDLSRGYGSFAELLSDPEVQSVHIGVPNHLHYEMVASALEAGKHVLCEKPLAMNSDETEKLCQLTKQYPELATCVNYNIRYYPLCLEIKERIQRGDIGDLFHVCGSYVQDWLLFSTDYNWRVLSEEGGKLRAISDIGTHWLDLVRSITGLEVEAVCADLQTVHPVRERPQGELKSFSSKQVPVKTDQIKINTDDFGSVLLQFNNGARGTLWVSQVVAGRKNCLRFEIVGSRQSVSWNSESPNEVWIGERNKENKSLLRDPALCGEAARNATSYPGGHNEGYADSFKHCFLSFYQYIANGDFSAPATFPTFQDGHHEILLCEAIQKSHQERRWIEV